MSAYCRHMSVLPSSLTPPSSLVPPSMLSSAAQGYSTAGGVGKFEAHAEEVARYSVTARAERDAM